MKSVNIIFFVLFAIIGLSSCDQANDWALDLIPDDGILTNYTILTEPVYGYTALEDTIFSRNVGITSWGSYVDPVLGNTKVEFASQFRNGVMLSKKSTTNPLSLDLTIWTKIDTILANNYYGEKDTKQKMIIYELLEDLKPDKSYYSNYTIPTSKLKYLGEFEYDNSKNDSIFKVSLPNALRDTIFNAITDSVGEGYLNDKLLAKFKGLYFATEQVTSGGAIFKFDFSNAKSALTLKYATGANIKDSLYVLTSSSNAVRVNFFSHEYSPEVLSNIAKGKNANRLYLQPFAGLVSVLEFPHLMALRDSIKTTGAKIAIERATLILPLDTTDLSYLTYSPVANITVYRNDKLIRDHYSAAGYQSINLVDKAYQIEIGASIMEYLKSDDTENYKLVITVSNPSSQPQRSVLSNFGPASGAKLSIKYSKINQ